MNLSNKKVPLTYVMIFVKRSAQFSVISSIATCRIFSATAPMQRWYVIEWCFFRDTDSIKIVILYTASLSQNILAFPSKGTPGILSFYLHASIISTSVSIAQNSAPKVLDSSVSCFLLYHYIGALLIYTNIPIWFFDVLVPSKICVYK